MKNFYNYLIYHGEGLPQGKKTDYLDFIIKNKSINKIKNKKQRHIIMNFNRHSDFVINSFLRLCYNADFL